MEPTSLVTPSELVLPEHQGHCVKVSVINGAMSRMRRDVLVAPSPATLKGSSNLQREFLTLSSYSFLIESQHRNEKVLFDLAYMQDLEQRLPPTAKQVLLGGNGTEGILNVDEYQSIPDILTDAGIELSSITSIILSHGHVDHTGDPAAFPASTRVVVGPGFKNACLPGYPKNPSSFLLNDSFEGRDVHELDFSTSSHSAPKELIGGLPAIDFFGDASMFVLWTPGHTMHHICVLCRTTERTWVLLAGDICHHVGQLRPNRWSPLPILSSSSLSPSSSSSMSSSSEDVSTYSPAYLLAAGMQENTQHAQDTLEKLQALDARRDVFVLLSHDTSLMKDIDLFPRDITHWKEKDWKEKTRWLFLSDELACERHRGCC